jgi:hypothetical protein
VYVILNDMVQAQKSAGGLGVTATHGCRLCGVTKAEYANQAYHICVHRKTDATRSHLRKHGTPEELWAAGMRPNAAFFEDSTIYLDVTCQVPPEPYHAEILGFQLLLLTAVVQSLTKTGRGVMSNNLRSIQLPQGWGALPTLELTKASKLKANGQSVKHIMQLIPFCLLNHGLSPTHICKQEHTRIIGQFPRAQTNTAKKRLALWVKNVQACLVAAAHAGRLVFATERVYDFDEEVQLRTDGTGPLLELDRAVKDSREAVAGFWPDLLEGRPNAHTTLHYAEAAHLFGCVSYLDVAVFEMHHKFIRSFVKLLSGRDTTVELLHHENIRQAIQFLGLGGVEGLTGRLSPEALALVLRQTDDTCYARLLRGPLHDEHGNFYGDYNDTQAVVTAMHHARTPQPPARTHITFITLSPLVFIRLPRLMSGVAAALTRATPPLIQSFIRPG